MPPPSGGTGKIGRSPKRRRIDIENIAKVIAANTGKTPEEVVDSMLKRTTLNPDQAKDWGLVHSIKSELFPPGTQVASIMVNQ